ncbi:MAG: glycoside hydrolase family 43 protein [Akkermansia sp.]
MKSLLMLVALAFFAMLPLQATPVVPNTSFKPGEIWHDTNGVAINAHGGGLYKEKGTYYWFGEHKVGGDAGNQAQVGVHCYSSKDLLNWKDEGIALKVAAPDSDSLIAQGCILERPKVIYNKKTRKYVMWFHLEVKGKGYGSAFSGRAVSDKVTGPYQFVKAGRINPGKWPMDIPKEKQTLDNAPAVPRLEGSWYPEGMDETAFFKRDFKDGQMARDMTLFVDAKEKAYHIYSSEENGTMHIAELSDDYLDHTGKFVRVFKGRFMEAPAICKKDGTYYLIASGCTGWSPNAARMAVAKSIWGPWKELKNPCVGKDAEKTFDGQSTFILPVAKKDGETTYLFLADIWRPQNAIDGRYMWLPISFDGDQMIIEWKDEWKLQNKFPKMIDC